MPRQDLIQIRRGTRAAFNALTSGSKLEAGELGAATDTKELLVGLGPTSDPFVVGSGGGGGDYFVRVDTGLNDQSQQTYAYKGGDQAGNAIGQTSLDIQSFRTAATQVASGRNSIAIGRLNTAGSDAANSSAAICFGINNTVLREGLAIGADNNVNNLFSFATCIGWHNTINDNATAIGANITSTTGFNAVLLGRIINHTGTPQQNEGNVMVGYQITANGEYIFGFGNGLNLTGGYSIVAGWVCTNSGFGSIIFGLMFNNSGTSCLCLGSGANTIDYTLNVQMGSSRIRGYNNTGQLALSVQNRATAYAHTAASEGSEPENTLRPGMFAIRRNGLEFRLDYNDNGTVRSLSLGTVV